MNISEECSQMLMFITERVALCLTLSIRIASITLNVILNFCTRSHCIIRRLQLNNQSTICVSFSSNMISNTSLVHFGFYFLFILTASIHFSCRIATRSFLFFFLRNVNSYICNTLEKSVKISFSFLSWFFFYFHSFTSVLILTCPSDVRCRFASRFGIIFILVEAIVNSII